MTAAINYSTLPLKSGFYNDALTITFVSVWFVLVYVMVKKVDVQLTVGMQNCSFSVQLGPLVNVDSVTAP